MTDLEADFAAHRMHSAQLPLEALADEFGAAAGRIERELKLKDEARAARFEARLAAIELASLRAEEQRDRHFNGILDLLERKFRGLEDSWESRICERLDSVKDGIDGKDADIEPLKKQLEEDVDRIREFSAELQIELAGRINARLAEVKDGKDGEPGKDADLQPLFDLVDGIERKHRGVLDTLEADLTSRLESRLAEVKDGKDGEPGKDADITPLEVRICDLVEQVTTSVSVAHERVDAKLAEVKDGKDGEPGPPGMDGKDGQDGKLPIAREWTNRVHYAGDVVRHNGATYQALADTGQQPPHSDWGELASRGTDGIGFVLRGTYDAAAEYKQHDIVMINRNSFAAKYDSPGECPGDGWQLFGPSGQRGKEGPPGMRGADGRSVSITNLEADADAMVLRITDSLGKTFELDIHPIAERIVEAAR